MPFGKSIIGVRRLSGFSGYTYDLALQRLEKGRYDATNGFGVSRNVRASEIETEGVGVTSKSIPKQVKGVRLVAGPDDAKQLRDRIEILLGLRVLLPLFVLEVGHQAPTLSDPEDLTFHEHYLVGELDCALLYDPKYQKVLFSMK
jgi:hypothetical protein